MNQAWVGGGAPPPYSAVPLLPWTAPGIEASAVPVPPVTTLRISERSVSRSEGSSGGATAPAAPPSKLRNERPPTVAVGGQSTTSCGRSPARRSAAVVTTLNVEPGG